MGTSQTGVQLLEGDGHRWISLHLGDPPKRFRNSFLLVFLVVGKRNEEILSQRCPVIRWKRESARFEFQKSAHLDQSMIKP